MERWSSWRGHLSVCYKNGKTARKSRRKAQYREENIHGPSSKRNDGM